MSNAITDGESWEAVKVRAPSGNRLTLVLACGAEQPWLRKVIPLVMRGKEGTRVRHSPQASVTTIQHPRTGQLYYFKEFYDRGFLDKIKKCLVPARGKKAFLAGRLLMQEGFLTPRPVAYGEERRFGFIVRNFLITEGVEAQPPRAYFAAHFELPLAPVALRQKRELLCNIASQVGRLHRLGIVHGDLRMANVIIQGQGAGTRFFFVDNERTRRRPVFPARQRMRNLVQLNLANLPQITPTDRMRFLRSYLNENPPLGMGKKALIRRIQKLTQGRIARRSTKLANEKPA